MNSTTVLAPQEPLDYSSPVLDQLPPHLKAFMVPQHYDSYTPADHAVWRFVMKRNVAYLSKVAHKSYLEGLQRTGITLESIPSVREMNEILGRIGWAACTVDGFIHPQAFMEFQAYKVLVIAADIRQIEHIQYTPAPDIIHEAAGHAPIIADADYAEYLRYFGEIGCRAFSSRRDFELFEAIRHLSIIKEDPYTPQADIQAGEQRIAEISADMGPPSEMALIRRLHWWTVEYGLIGTLENPQIYGAGLLSSIGESMWCMRPEVKKLPYTLDAMHVDFDITRPQPQLFVTPDFDHLKDVLNQFADGMALRRGGIYGLQKARESGSMATVVLSSGIQISGILNDFKQDAWNRPSFVRFSGPVSLAYNNSQIPGQGADYHVHGFSTLVGKIRGIETRLEHWTSDTFHQNGFVPGNRVQATFESGISLEGRFLENIRSQEGTNLIFRFEDCAVRLGDEILFRPEWGVFDLAVGHSVISVFSGVADPWSFPLHFEPPREKTHKIQYSDDMRRLHQMYGQVRKVREGTEPPESLLDILDALPAINAHSWLLVLEILEILKPIEKFAPVCALWQEKLQSAAQELPELSELLTESIPA
ncbi:MAG: aromatic amino acid hydroxylase [Flavobacteriales bacterium]|nr:aromatic amino acid hydroxylase [Flavobacteriales bacterium]MDW8431095.1 aromatic amino acid hydroxylase [Flavobacteriales bacterium]